nr:kelch-like protein 10 [Parasteatoda tepidariorum]
MSLCSPYFRALFTSKINKHPRREFRIPGIGTDMLSLIIYYAYTGKTGVTEENVASLLPAADQFCVDGMIEDCSHFLIERMNYENCIGIGQFARCYFVFSLETTVYWYLMSHFVEVVRKSEDFLELPLQDVIKLLNSDRINVRSEETVWEAGIRWIDHKVDERRQYIDSIMRCVRLGLLDTQYFIEKVKKHHYLENNESCDDIVIETQGFLYDVATISQKVAEVEMPILAIPRIPYAVLFTIGGWSGGPTNVIETYDAKADRWIKVRMTDPFGPRAYHKLAVIGTDIYVIGGFDGLNYFNDCLRFNVVTKEWSEVAPMQCKRCYVSVACLNNVIYAIGGYDGHYRQNTVERYDIKTNQWTFVAPMNVQRSDADATTLNDRIYAVGGFSGNECLACGEYYDPITDQWSLLTSMSQRRSGVSVIAHRGCIFALGGFNGLSRLKDGEKYNPLTDEWYNIAEMSYPRSNFAVQVLDGMIFVIGGFDGATTIGKVECYDDRENEWYEATSMNTSRSALAASVLPRLPNVDDYIYKNRSGLLEELRLKVRHQTEGSRNRYNAFMDYGELRLG